MDSDVIVLDSSDDETPKNSSNKTSKLISTLHKLNQITCTVIENNPEKKMSKNRVSISSRYSCNSELYASKKRHQINTKIPIRNPINEHKGMPIIVKTQSLSKNLVNTPNSIKIEKVTSEPKVVKTVPLPFVTVIKKGKNVSSKSVFDIVKYGPIINIDDDEDVEKGESLQPLSISMEVMDIESGDNTKDEKSPERKGQEQVHCKEITRNGFEASLSIDESSEKENFESVIKKSYNNNDIDEPLQKKTKFIDLKSLHSEVECCKITKKLNDSPISSNTNRQINTNIDDKVEKKDSEADIHPVFQQFLNLYLTFDKYNDKKKNVADKLTKYYKAIDKNYAKSEEFCSFIKKKMFEMKQYPKQSMLYVREIADDLKAHRLISNSIKAASSKSAVTDVEIRDSKVQKKIEYLEKLITRLNRKIKILDETEVTTDDEESAYVKADSYKSRLIKVYNKLCSLKGERGLRKQKRIDHLLSGLSGLEQQLPDVLKLIKKSANQSDYWFPDFQDIVSYVQEAVQNAKLDWSSEKIRSKAQYIFTEIGTAIQKERKCSEYFNLCAISSNSADPAENDPELEDALNKNRVTSHKKLNELFNKYVEIQFSSNLEAEEVSDKDSDMDTDKDTDGDTDKNIEDAAVQSDKDDLEIIETSPDS